MKRISAILIVSLISNFRPLKKITEQHLLWKISGNGLKNPSYLFGTIHMLCADDAVLSDSLKKAISKLAMKFILKWTWTICLK